MSRRHASRFAAVVVAAGLAIGVAVASGEGSGGGVAETELSRARIAEPFTMETTDASDYVVLKMTVDPGWSSGWHSHPGTTLVAVTSGELTVYAGDDPTCTPRTFATGQGGAEAAGRKILARNEGSTPTEMYVTYVVPAGSPPGREEPGPAHCP